MAWSNTGGGDHEGDSWTIANGTTIAGVHYNIATVTIANGSTVNIQQGTPLEIHAETINMQGIINGNYKGYQGGLTGGDDGQGPGGGDGGSSDEDDGGGGAYGGNGGTTSDAAGGVAYGDSYLPHIQMGSGGGCGDGLDGGYGGGAVTLVADTLNINSGQINCAGELGDNGANSGGGGGSGGGILLIGNNIDLDNATLDCHGGNGGNEIDGTAGGGGVGGAGGGGRIKIFAFTSLTEVGVTKNVAAGIRYGSPGAGTSFSGDMSQCNSTYAFGQTFKLDTGFPTAVSKIDLYVKSITTTGDFTVKIWEDPAKTTEYATKTVSISTTGVLEVVFDSTIQLPSSDTEYYLEVTPDSTGDVQFGTNGYSSILEGSMYYGGYEIVGLEAYMVLYGYSHVTGPTLLNLADDTVRCEIANSMLSGAIHKINRDGSGSIDYSNDFTSDKYLSDAFETSGTTYDGVNDKLDLADDGYILWKVDTKYPVAGIPTLTAQIEVISGTPTLQVSYDGTTWVDIDDTIVNDVDTEYELTALNQVSFKGRTVIWLRLDCTGIGTNECSLKTMDIHVDIVTVHAIIPEIIRGTDNTFRLDQDSGSALNCTIELDWRDRKLM
jgi:hypothetical protein